MDHLRAGLAVPVPALVSARLLEGWRGGEDSRVTGRKAGETEDNRSETWSS